MSTKSQKTFKHLEATNGAYKFNLKSSVFDGLTISFVLAVLVYLLLQPNEDELLLLGRNSSWYGVLFVLSMLASYFVNRQGIKTWGEKIFEPDYRKTHGEEVPMLKSFWGWQAVITMLISFAIGLRVTEFSFEKVLDRDGFQGAVRIFSELLRPNFEILPRAVVRMFETIFMAFIATAFAIPIAFVLSFFAAKNIMKHPLAFVFYLLLRTLLNITRSVEAFMWAIIFAVWVGIGPAAGMLALMIHSIASLAKQYSEIIESVGDGPIEGVLSCGANKLQTIWYAIVPQVVLPFISFTVYRWDINVRMATIVGFVGGGGIGKLLIAYQGQAQWKEVGCIFLVIAIVVWLLDQGSAYIREALK